MERTEKDTERSSVFIGILTLVIIGISLIANAWQMLSQQKEASQQHLEVTAHFVLHAVESTLKNTAFQGAEGGFTPEAEKFFRVLEQGGEVLFVGLLDEKGGRVFSARDSQEESSVRIPPEALASMATQGLWQGDALYGEKPTFLAVKRLEQVAVDLSRGSQLPVYLMVGIDSSTHTRIYRSFRQNALLQTAYILAVAFFFWSLSISVLRRREVVNRAANLEHFQAHLLDNLPDGLITVDSQGKVQSANPAAANILGLPQLSGMHIQDFPTGIANSIATPTAHSEDAIGWIHETVDGADLEILTVPYQEENGEAVLMIIIRDRTQVRQLERSLAEAEKRATVGTLAAGVAHEIRNPLSALRGFAQYFSRKFVGKQPEEEYAQTMVREADRLNRVISDLLYLAKPSAIKQNQLLLQSVVQELEALVQLELAAMQVRLEYELFTDSIFADADSLKQVLLNLILNSLDALQETPEEARVITLRAQECPKGVQLDLEDTGTGMSKQEAAQAFEPFFTAKRKGTGLGLALVYKTMLEHGGLASIHSEVGQGCRITLFFPNEVIRNTQINE